jgi:hypothetical protein
MDYLLCPFRIFKKPTLQNRFFENTKGFKKGPSRLSLAGRAQ